jgi:hypothetical protein
VARLSLPKAPIVRVLLNGHQLHSIISERLDPRQNVVPELRIRVDLGLDAAHPDVGFIDSQALWAIGLWVLEHVPLLWVFGSIL